MTSQPFYDPLKTYEENFADGPFGEFADEKVYENKGEPKYKAFGLPVFLPFGIPAGPLLNGKYVAAALDHGFDIVVYKTVRTREYPCAAWPNVLGIHLPGNLTLQKAEEGIVGDQTYDEPLAITNSFGVPSQNPDFWQPDMEKAVKHAKKGQFVIGSFQGTTGGTPEQYIQDFVLAAKLVKETGAPVLEVNFSCPNEGTAHLLCYDIDRVKLVVEAIKNEIGNTPLAIKVAYFPNQEELIKLIKTVGKTVQGISAINTIPAKIFDKDGNQALPGQNRLRAGVCGHAIQWAGLEMVERLKKLREELSHSYSIIGVGGVTKPEDYTTYRNAGADIVMSATGAMWHPDLAKRIKETL